MSKAILYKTYTVNTLCKNCGAKAEYEIDYSRKVLDCTCDNCGCFSLEYSDSESTIKLKASHNKGKKINQVKISK